MKSFHPVEKGLALHFENVSFSYGQAKVLENASFHIHQGEFVALVGPNGSGKTTIIKLVLGLEEALEGRIEILGAVPAIGRNYVGYMPQQTSADGSFPISVKNVVKMGLLKAVFRRPQNTDRKTAEAAVEEAMSQAGISSLASRPFSALSGGQRRRVLVARALASRPKILILDEPTANMDAESEERLYNTLGTLKGSTTILIVTHNRLFVSSLVDRVLCLGDKPHSAGFYGVVQHRIEQTGSGGAGLAEDFRVIHSDGIPADSCYDGHSVANTDGHGEG